MEILAAIIGFIIGILSGITFAMLSTIKSLRSASDNELRISEEEFLSIIPYIYPTKLPNGEYTFRCLRCKRAYKAPTDRVELTRCPHCVAEAKKELKEAETEKEDSNATTN